jgi:hypothetical protein
MQFYTVFVSVIPFYYDSGTVINYGSVSAEVRNYNMVPVPLRQKVTVLTVKPYILSALFFCSTDIFANSFVETPMFFIAPSSFRTLLQ